ncbi:alkaline phosphatase family protein [Halolamina sp. C58]|uniref:alkaline phosphatase family protein n=1 Tax=Halolamina sp. C58 TaxID=3421640 RepID=UPI003EBF7150
MQTLLIGLDAACERVLDPLFEDGALPNLEAVFDRGKSGPLASQIPPWTASAWPSLYTGANPGKHGVFDFLSFVGYEWDLVNASHVRRRTVWEYLDEAGYTSAVVNAPVTAPPRSFDGALIPGYLAPEHPECHPAGLLDDVREELDGYRVYAPRETDESQSDDAKFQSYLDLTRSRGEALRYLDKRFDPDFGFVQFQKTDAVFHDFPGDEAKVRAIYEVVDDQIGAMLDECDPETVIVASDHGMGPYDGHEFRVNDYLKGTGDVVTTREGDSVPSWFQLKDQKLVGDEQTEHPTLARAGALAAKFGLTYQRGKSILETLGLADFVGRHVPVSAVFAASERVDRANSRAYLRSPSELGIRMNVAGREPEGEIPSAEYDTAREALMERLRDVETPEGEPVFESVLPREEHIHGPYAEEAVDILCVPRNFEHSLSSLIGEMWGEPEPYNHKRDGIVAVSGTGADEAELRDATIFDVTPTVLASMDVAPDETMDGRSFVSGPGPEAYPAFEAGERAGTNDEDVEERLADLGYLE